jgi:hypothetical protein
MFTDYFSHVPYGAFFFFFWFLISISWSSDVGDQTQEELAKFGYREERKVEKMLLVKSF